MKERVDDTLYGVEHNIADPKTYRKINVSSYAWLSNWLVTKRSFRENPIVGTGLGTYELDYDRYLPLDMQNYFDLNRMDANSMGLRLLTETGLVGISLFCFFILMNRIRSRPDFTNEQEVIWILNSGIFIVILLSLLRNGNYTSHGKVLFFLLYYYTYQKIRPRVRQGEKNG